MIMVVLKLLKPVFSGCDKEDSRKCLTHGGVTKIIAKRMEWRSDDTEINVGYRTFFEGFICIDPHDKVITIGDDKKEQV